MTTSSSRVDQLSDQLREMYNAFPFPNRSRIPEVKSDERYGHIYSRFLNIPIHQLRDTTFFDAGCGTGDVTWVWQRLLDRSNQVLAVDLSFNSIRIARHEYPDAVSSPDFCVGSLLDLGLPSESVDVVHCSGVLVAVPDPDRAFRELTRVLKPGGFLILALYHKYGRLMHGLRRAIIDAIEPADIDRRAKLGGKLFGRNMQKFVREEHAPYENILYDQFGLPCESRYSVKDVLKWFSSSGIEYLGSWPPVEWSQFGNALRFSKKFEDKAEKLWYRIILEMFPQNDDPPSSPPSRFSQATMQTLWLLDQLQLFSISGRKISHR